MSTVTTLKQIRLADDADEQGLVERKTYEDAVILGPAMLVPMKDVTLDSNTFLGDPNALFIEFPDGASIQGGIGLRNVTFRRCTFHNVSIAGTPEVIAEIRSRFQFPRSTTTLEARPAAVIPQS
jgi:hypothetical protein